MEGGLAIGKKVHMLLLSFRMLVALVDVEKLRQMLSVPLSKYTIDAKQPQNVERNTKLNVDCKKIIFHP